MNEAVKKLLLQERKAALRLLATARSAVVCQREALTDGEQLVVDREARLADLNIALTEAGVDLAAVDAEAEKARDGVQRVVARNGLLCQEYGQSQASLGNSTQRYADAQNARNQYDPTAGLAKALDEA